MEYNNKQRPIIIQNCDIETNVIYNENCLDGLRRLPDCCVNCCVTSPPYFNLRDYGCEGQIGLESTPEEYIVNLLNVFEEVHRILMPDGTLWVNIGDSYAGSGKGAARYPENAKQYKQGTNKGTLDIPATVKKYAGYKNKDLIGIPWMLAFALSDQGWYLRQDIIWAKPNSMPESVKDRCTKSHEYIFLLSKSNRYYFDSESIKVPAKESTKIRLNQNIENQKGSNRVPGTVNGPMKAVIGGRKRQRVNDSLSPSDPMFRHNSFREYEYTETVNRRSVWNVSTKPFKDSHFATFPEDLITPCIMSGCPEEGVVLDPFMGSGTTAIVARKLNRKYIGFELNPEYVRISEKRMRKELGLFSN